MYRRSLPSVVVVRTRLSVSIYQSMSQEQMVESHEYTSVIYSEVNDTQYLKHSCKYINKT